MHKLKEFFDVDFWKITGFGAVGTAAGWPVEKMLGVTVSALTIICLLVKLAKQIRDWKKPEKDE